MADYNLKVGKSELKPAGTELRIELTRLDPIPPSTLDLEVICLRAPTPTPPSSILGTGDIAYGAATVVLERTKVEAIHNQVNDGKSNYHLSVHFNVSAANVVSNFGKTYST